MSKKEREVLIYTGLSRQNEDNYRGRFPSNTRAGFKKWYNEHGYVGYLSGYRNDIFGTVSVLVFFYEKPPLTEIQRRRRNGFKSAKWYWIN